MRQVKPAVKQCIALVLALLMVVTGIPVIQTPSVQAADLNGKPTTGLTADVFQDLGGEKWYIRGDAITTNGWVSCDVVNQMSRIVDQLYAASYVLEAGSYEFKAATSDWGKSIGVDATNNFKITLLEKSKINIYARIDIGKAWISGENQSGNKLTSSIITDGGSNLAIYNPACSEANWPRLVGTVQTALGESADWDPAASGLFLYDYGMDGTDYRYECTLAPKGSAYEAKATMGNDWTTSYGDGGSGNTQVEVTVPSTVIFTLKPNENRLYAGVIPNGLSVTGTNFSSLGVTVAKKEFIFTFSEAISLVSGKTIKDAVTLTSTTAAAPGIASAEISAENANQLIVKLDSTNLAYDTEYTFEINAGYFESGNGTENDLYQTSFTTQQQEAAGPATADTFTALESDDKYVVAGNFQKLAGETSNWAPSSKVTQLKRVTGDLWAYSLVLPATKDAGLENGEKAYQFKVVKNGSWDDAGSFSGGTASNGNYEFTLDEESRVTLFINTETHQMAVNTAISGADVQYYYYNQASMPRLTGSIQGLFGENADDFDAAGQNFFDYYFDGSEYRLERKIGPTTKSLTAKAQVKKAGIVSDLGTQITVSPITRSIDTTFIVKGSALSIKHNIYEPQLALAASPSQIQKGSSFTFAASFRNEYKETTDLTSGVTWTLEQGAAGVTLSNQGVLKIEESVPAGTKLKIKASYAYSNGMTADINKTYEAKAEVTVAETVTNFKFNYLRYNGDYDGWNLWVWLDGAEGSKYDVLKEKDGWYSGVVSIPEAVEKINFITRKGEWADQEGGNRVFDLSKGSEVWLVEGEKAVYYSKEEATKPRISTAVMNSANKVEFSINGSGKDVNYSGFSLKVNDKKVSATSAENGKNQGVITISDTVKPWDKVEVVDLAGVYASKIVTMQDVLDDYYYDGSDLGYTKNGSNSSFKVWAPTAAKVSVALYTSAGTYNEGGIVTDQTPNSTVEMVRDEQTGVWSKSFSVASAYKYYMYKVEFADGTVEYAVDPYARSVSANGQRTAMIDVSTLNPAGWDPSSKPAEVVEDADHVLYELQVRDFSIDPDAGFKNKGKFKAFTETGLKDSSGNSIGIDHLKELGITTVHLLPSYDFAEANELKVDDPSYTGRKYNWGYDPQNYNVPEGCYSTDPSNPSKRVLEFKEMVQALHNAGIRVVMDVVYNHTYSIENGPFHKIVPGYFYRFDSTGNYSNGSGCGNEVASENPMVRKYIKDSVKYWAKEYNVDGFRFDLFGLIDEETAAQLTKELKEEIDPSIIVYGEPWTGGATPLTNGVAKGSQKDQGYAVFNDNIRGAIKGGSDDTSTGFATGASGKEEAVVKGIWGSTGDFTNAPTETINYVTAHDNLNLWDKIIVAQGLNDTNQMLYGRIQDGSMKDGSSVDAAVEAADPYKGVNLNDVFANETVKRSVLANSMILTMQGIPFIHAGDEFLRSKYGDHNSYRSPDSVNMIRWENKAKFKPVADYYQGLLELRKNHPAFRINTKEALVNNLVVCRSSGNVIVYILKNHANGDKWNNIVVIYNGNSTAQNIDMGDFAEAAGIADWNIVVNDTKAGEEVIGKTNGKQVSVPGISTMILYDSENVSPGAENVKSIELSKDSLAMTPEEQIYVQVTYKNQDGAVLKSGNLTVESSDEMVIKAAVSDTANFTKVKVTAVAPGTATITFKAKDYGSTPAADIVKKLTVKVVGVRATISPAKASYRENPVITVDTGDLEVSKITANLSQVGGSRSYEVSTITKEISFGIKEHIGTGTKSIPITVTDSTGKTYKVNGQVEVTEAPESGFGWEEAVIYFMVTDRFYDGNTSNNGVLVDKDNPGAYHGGDFAGVTKKLDYLKELGVNTIWITPIVENVTGDWGDPQKGSYYAYHGYWATDFKKLNPYLGTKEELNTLIEEAHDRGIKIMTDVVLNHAGYFDSSRPLKDSTIPGMLRNSGITDGDEKQWIAGLPDFETEKQLVRQQVIDWQTAWASLKTNRGDTIDYYRVDTVKHVDHETWKQFKTALAKNNASFKLIGEVFDSDSKINSYLDNGEMDSALDFSFKDTALKFVKEGELEAAESALEARNARVSNTASLGQFLSSHDEDGFLDVKLGGDTAKMMAAASLQITAKGQPVIYYGEEIGQSGANNWPVYDNRKDFNWTSANKDNTMLTHYKKLLAARNKYSKAFAKGGRRKAAGSNKDGYMVFARTYRSDEVFVGINVDNIEKTVIIPTGCKKGEKVTDLYSGTVYETDEDGNITVTIPAMKNGGTVILPTEIEWNPEDPDVPPSTGESTIINPPNGDNVTTIITKNPDGSTTKTMNMDSTDSQGIKTSVEIKVIVDKEGKLINEATISQEGMQIRQADKTAALFVMIEKDLLKEIEGLTENKESIALTIKLPSGEIQKALTSKGADKGEVYLILPDTQDAAEGRIIYQGIILGKEVLSTAKKQKKDLMVSVENADGKMLYSWTADGELLAKSSRTVKDVNLNLTLDAANNQSALKKLLKKDTNNTVKGKTRGIVIDLSHSGLFPATMNLKLDARSEPYSVSGIKAGSTVYLYHYNEKTRRLDEVPNNKYKVDKEGYVTVAVTHASSYVLLPKKAAAAIRVPLLGQVVLQTRKMTLSTKSTKKAKAAIKLSMPSTLVKKQTFSKSQKDPAAAEVKVSYRSSNSKIAGVTKNGTVVAKKKGKAVITITVVLANGTKKSFKTQVTVK